ncbi:MAG TPA: aminotransferase class V-fold PLP-dependent enzyme [Blastocatellia bacterium]|jgi:cysteine desulfurase/selenocysteine lyase|nr:aminotransferase class V-fold PLP-dependent enzyme [Blastocatellia bacterium]
MNETIRSLFPITKNYIYMNHAAVSPLSTRVRDAMASLADDVMRHGTAHYEDWYRTYDNVRSSAARLVNARPHEIAFVRNTSDGISTVANGLDLREGDNIVTSDVEFPSNIYPWMRLGEERGLKMKLAPERDGRIDPGELLSLVDDRTRVVSISWVQFGSGFRSDLAHIGKFCRERGIFFLVDAIQGLGALKLDVERDYVDAFAADAHKYLLGPEGAALLYVSDRVIDRVRPTVVGWTSVKDYERYLDYDLTYRDGALRFECGSLNTVGVYGLGAAIDLFLEVGTEQIEEYVVGLSRYLGDRLTEKGYVVAGSRNPGEMSAVVTCTHEKHSPANLSRQLRAKNIITAPRVKRLRIAPHFYNTRDEIDTLIDVLPS